MTPQTPPTDRPLTAGDARMMEQIAHNLCSLHDFDVALVAGLERFAKAVITEYERARPATSAASEGEAITRLTAALKNESAHWCLSDSHPEETAVDVQVRDLRVALAALASPPPAREEAPAEGAGEREDLKAANKDHCRAVNTLTLEAIELERQIADLRAYVVKANSGFEEYERKFYLASDEVERLKLAICGGEDVPGSINAVSVDDCERFITEERGRHIDTEARLEYVRASRDGAAGRAHDLYMALAEVKEQVVTYPLSDNSTCMCGAPLGGHNVGSGHAPVSLADHAISLIVEGIDKALRFGAPTDGRPDDYEGPDAGMHDTEIVERDND